VVVETPIKLTDRQKDLLREFEQLTVEGGAKHSPQSKSWMDKVKEFFE
jgi:molecular chaperone DnaJ